MTQMTVRGLPATLMTDGWWLDGAGQANPPGQGAAPARPGPVAVALLAFLLVAADLLLWQVMPGGLALAVLGLLLLLCAALANDGRGAGGVLTGALFLLPLVEHVQLLSLALAGLGLAFGLGWIALGGWRGVGQTLAASLRLIEAGPNLILRDLVMVARRSDQATPRDPVSVLRGWALPLGLGLVFAALLVGANPMLSRLVTWPEGLDLPAAERVLFWLGLACLIWPVLRLVAMTQRLRLPLALPGRPPVPAVINAASVRRSLVLFNGLFALQTISDIAYLWAGAALPEGMSYASYAHRGAYPLLLAALLAGAFALIARPFVADDRRLRAALLFWVGQTCLLVLSSMLRLDLYIETYGLTRLRLAALIWMVTTAIGLALLIWQITRNHAAPWLLIRAAALGLCALYGASLFSFDRAIAQYNLTRPVPVDPFYICVLGSDALPAIVAWEQATGYRLCQRLRAVPARPQDWREWGFRNARTRSSLAALGFGGI